MNSKILWRAAGIAAFVATLFLPLPAVISWPARVVLGMTFWMAIYWVSEAVPLAIASLIPLVVLPLFSVMPMDKTAHLYSDPNIFLFMGGFFLALAMEKCALQKRIALHLISMAGSGPRGLLAGFLIATAAISMWVSNTATTLMMLPIALAVIKQLEKNSPESGESNSHFAAALMLGIAYASSIGGIATLVGTPPNMIFAGQVKALFPDFPEVSFVRWFLLCFPVAAGFLLITWGYLAWIVCGNLKVRGFDRQLIKKEIAALGPWSGDEKKVMMIFALTVFAWIFRGDIPLGNFTLRGWAGLFGIKGLHDGTVAIAAAILLFMIPSDKKSDALLNWEWAVKIPWDVLLLIGGGFALAEGFQESGLAAGMAGGFTGFQGQPLFMILPVLCLATNFSSELMSNSPQVTIMMPVLASAAASMKLHPYWLMIPATLMASLAFMLPAGTPPNAIVFASGHVKMRQMIKTGFILNLLAALWVSVCLYFLLPVFFDVK